MIRAIIPAVALLALAACGGDGAPDAPSGASLAEAPACVLPERITPAGPERPPRDEIVADAEVAFNMMAIAWSPQWCATNGGNPAYAHQCRASDFGFVLHGLWPNAAEGPHPRYCSVTTAPAMRAETVRRHFCMTPSEYLLQHEWAAHGTCGWETPEAYFDQAARLWNALSLPDLDPAGLTAGGVRDAFVAANPGLPRNGIYIAVAPGNWLREVRLCYDRDYRPARCLRGLGTPDRVALRLRPRRSDTP